MIGLDRIQRIIVACGIVFAIASASGTARSWAQCSLTIANTTGCTLTISVGGTIVMVPSGTNRTANLPGCPPIPAFAVEICGVMQALTVGGCCNSVVTGECCADVCLTAGIPGTLQLSVTPAPGPCKCVC